MTAQNLDPQAEFLALVRSLAVEVAPQLEAPLRQLTLASPLSALGLDSVAVLEVIGQLEAHFNCELPDDLLLHVRTVGDLYALVPRAQ